MRMWRVLIVAAALLPVVGCGAGADGRDAASSTALGLLSAVTAQDGAGACAVLAPDTVAELEQSAGKVCADAVIEEDLPGPGPVRSVDVYGQWARVALDDDTLFLAAFGSGWRVVAAGCTARGDDRPYDCTLQGS
jgi:hypothetical protein